MRSVDQPTLLWQDVPSDKASSAGFKMAKSPTQAFNYSYNAMTSTAGNT